MGKRKYTKCQCCPYYYKSDKKWKCYKRFCTFCNTDDTTQDLEINVGIIERWLKANKE